MNTQEYCLDAIVNGTPGNRGAWEAATRVIREKLNAALLDRLEGILAKNKAKLADVADLLGQWVKQDANLEALATWAKAGGFKSLGPDELDELEARLVAAGVANAKLPGMLAREEGKPVRYIGGVYETAGKFSFMFYDTPRAESMADKNGEMPAQFDGTILKVFDPAALPQKVKAYYGPEALRVGLGLHDWNGLYSCYAPSLHKDKPLTPAPGGDWLAYIAGFWLLDRAGVERDRLQREGQAKELKKAPRVHVSGHDFRRLSKVAAGMSWAFGGSGVPLSAVKVDGHEYAPAPNLSIATHAPLVPAGFSLISEDEAKKPHQTFLPIDPNGDEYAQPLPVALTNATQYAITPAAGKLGLVLMAVAHTGGDLLHKTTLRELAHIINPDAKQIKGTHFETVSKSLVQLDGLRLQLPDGWLYRVFECPTRWKELTPKDYDSPLFFGMARSFQKTLATIAEHAGKSYKGDFLFDLTGAMKLPTKKAGLLRQYIRAAAFWNAYFTPATGGRPDPDRMPAVPAEKWAAMTNYLPPSAVKKDRRRLSDSVKQTIEDAKELEGKGLVKIERADRKKIKLVPPPEYMEAWEQSKKGAHRMPGNTKE